MGGVSVMILLMTGVWGLRIADDGKEKVIFYGIIYDFTKIVR